MEVHETGFAWRFIREFEGYAWCECLLTSYHNRCLDDTRWPVTPTVRQRQHAGGRGL